MTVPKVSTIQRGGSRFYINPENPDDKVPGVTSIVAMLPKPFLQYWAAKVVAEEAVAGLQDGSLQVLAARNPEGAIDYLKGSPRRVTRKAADVGSYAHDLFERMARGERIGPVAEELEPFVRHYQEFLDVVQPEFHYLEETVWSDQHAYAGSFDAYATIQGERVWLDNKTTRSGVYAETGLQLAAYRHADAIIRADGGRIPQPKADGGAVVHIRPEGWKVVPVRCDEEVFEAFLHLRATFEYERTTHKTILGKPVFSGPEDDRETGPRINRPTVRK